mgnify:CR=1 FL=1
MFGTYLHGLFDSGELTEQLAAYLCRRKGIAPETAAPLAMADYRTQQLDLLADGVRSALDMDAVYAAMGLHNPQRREKNDTAASSAPPILSARAWGIITAELAARGLTVPPEKRRRGQARYSHDSGF